MKEFECKTCKEKFLSKKACKSRTPLFCSSKCFGKTLAKEKICKHCSQVFVNWQNKDFCSISCAGAEKRGRPLSESHRAALKGKRPKTQGEKNHKWLGDSVGYGGLHDWVYTILGSPMICVSCSKLCVTNKEIHWANKSGEYKRNVEDWLRLCVSCHKNYDLTRLGKQKV